MSFIDRIAAAVAPAASDEARADARRKIWLIADEEPWIAAIVEQHQLIENLITEALNASDVAARETCTRDLVLLLTAHSSAEETVVYPDVSQLDSKSHAALAYEEHAMTKIQLSALEKLNPAENEWREKLLHIKSALQQHIHQEENSWLPRLSEVMPPDEKHRVTSRFYEEFERYHGGARRAKDDEERYSENSDDADQQPNTMKLQAMPRDGRPGAADGVNTQAEWGTSGGSDAAAPYPNPHTGKADSEKDNFASGLMGHGGQSGMEYHGGGQLGERNVKRGGNINSGSQGS